MVSLRVIPADSSVNTLFPSSLGDFSWNTIAGTYYGVDKMKPTIGYWLAIPDGTTDEVYGLPLDSFTVHFFDQGWYMIGSVMGSTDFTNPNDNPDGMVISPAFGWNADIGEYFQTTTLEEKNGYWAAVFGECDLTVGEGLSGGEMVKSLAKADWTAFTSRLGSTPPSPPNIDFKTGDLVLVPTEYSFSQNYPNPFNPKTTIQYQIPKSSEVVITIFNMNGGKVTDLFVGSKEPGYHKLTWYASDCPSGMYVIRFQAGSYIQMRKCILLK